MKQKLSFSIMVILSLLMLAACMLVNRESEPVAQSPAPALQPGNVAIPLASRVKPIETAVPPSATTEATLPALPAPPSAPDLPIMGNGGPPATDFCTVAHPGAGDTGPLYSYSAPLPASGPSL